jgi:probable HAF family extracellular repeat protein
MKTLISNLRVSFAVLLMIVVVSSLSAAQQYTVTDLGTLGGPVSNAIAINDFGHVVGFASVSNNSDVQHAFVWTATAGMHDLGTVSGHDADFSYAESINNSGSIVGYSFANAGPLRAFLWTQGGGMRDLGTLGGTTAGASGINNLGQVVGDSALAGDLASHAFLWTAAGGMQDLGTLGGDYSHAYAINDLGKVVGFSFLSDNVTMHAFAWTQATGMRDLGALSGRGSQATSISATGQIVGFSYSGPLQTAVRWASSNKIQVLGGLAIGTGSVALQPYAPLVFDSAGNLYGASIGGGRYKSGAVFSFAP